MKVYLFFIYVDSNKLYEYPIAKNYIMNKCRDEIPAGIIRVFYAYTSNKSIRDEFIQTRNMKLFGNTYSTLNIDGQEELDKFESLYGEKELIRMRYSEHKLNKDGIGSVILTMDELSYIKYDYFERDFFTDYIDDLPPMDIFKKELHKMFETIEYPIQSLFDFLDTNINFDQFVFDELNLFIKIFGNTFNERK